LTLASPLQFSQGFGPASMAVDPTGKFVCVASQELNATLVFRIGNDGVLTAVTGSPFAAGKFPNSVAVSPLVPFASSSAELEIHNDIVSLSESFTLGANSNGIDPVTEKVTLQIGTFSVTIPAGSFKLNPDQIYSFQGVINGVSTQVRISKSGERLFILDAVFTPLDLSGITNPETVVLTFGIDSGSTAATVIFD
jgi:DNA-binding beta-propeller fold protein YncE